MRHHSVPVGTIEAFADVVPWGTNVKGEKGENGFEPIGTDDRDLVTHRSRVTADCSVEPGEQSREPPAGASTNSPVGGRNFKGRFRGRTGPTRKSDSAFSVYSERPNLP